MKDVVSNLHRVRAGRQRSSLRLETLEDRTVPATFTPLSASVDGDLGSLRANLVEANANGEASNTFTLEAGIYGLTIANSSGQENAATQGDLDLIAGKTYIFEGAGTNATVINGNSLDRVFQVFSGATVLFRNLTITGGLAHDNGSAGVLGNDAWGGGILSAGNVTLENVTLTKNSARGSSGLDGEDGGNGTAGHAALGGGVYQSGGNLTLTNSTVSHNEAFGGRGGNGGDGVIDSQVPDDAENVDSVDVGPNPALNGGNGANGGEASGGGLHVAAGNVTASGSTIHTNAATAGDGGAAGSGVVSGSAGAGGTALGAGVRLVNGKLTLTNSTVSSNSAVGGNGATGGAAAGAGLYLNSRATASIYSSTIAANGTSATGVTEGGNIHNTRGGVVTAVSTLISDGAAANGADVLGKINASASLIENTAGTKIKTGSRPNVTGVDPHLGALQANGGPTFTHALASDSAARDAGDNPDQLTTDQRGAARVQGAAADIGAVEGTAQATPTPSGGTVLTVIGADSGAMPRIEVYDAATGEQRFNFFAYQPSFLGGVHVAVGDVNGDGTSDIITGAGASGGPHVRVFSGVDRRELYSFMAYDPDFSGGVYVAAGDVNGDGHDDIITGAGAGGGPHVKVFDGATGAEITSFYAFEESFGYGVTVAAGDTDGDGLAEVIAAAGTGGGSQVRIFNGLTTALLQTIQPFGESTGGVWVTTNDVNDDGYADLITGAGEGERPEVRVYSGHDGSLQASFLAYGDGFTAGVRVGTYTLNGRHYISTGAGPGASPHYQVFDAVTLQQVESFLFTSSKPNSGLFVA